MTQESICPTSLHSLSWARGSNQGSLSQTSRARSLLLLSIERQGHEWVPSESLLKFLPIHHTSAFS